MKESLACWEGGERREGVRDRVNAAWREEVRDRENAADGKERAEWGQ
jgi:hypothetical protein